MFRRDCVRIAAIAFCAALSCAGLAGQVMAQGGSTGGSLGKSDPEVSGTVPKQAAPKPPANREPAREAPKSKPASLSASGSWQWQAQCTNGSHWSGQFFLTQGSDGSLSGRCQMAGAYGCGDVSGKVRGNSANFTVFWADPLGGHRNPFTFTIADGGRSMRGYEESVANGRCTYSARRM